MERVISGYGHNSNATKPAVTKADQRPGILLFILRRHYKLSQEKIAGYLGVSFQQVQKYERGTNRMAAPKIETAATLFSVPIAAFFREFDPDDPDIFNKIEALKYERELHCMFHDLDQNAQIDFLKITETAYLALKNKRK